MSNIDKQALREAAVAIETVATPQKLLAFRVKVTPQVVLALLDENLQLQREKDAIEAVALALRDDMRQAREQLEAGWKQNATDVQIKARLCRESNSLHDRLREA
ncbi:ead/Ea22-like family protein, partial [Salmonella enterica]|nr:ead/Ea22-like family protein [Salmonella enterica]